MPVCRCTNFLESLIRVVAFSVPMIFSPNDKTHACKNRKNSEGSITGTPPASLCLKDLFPLFQFCAENTNKTKKMFTVLLFVVLLILIILLVLFS